MKKALAVFIVIGLTGCATREPYYGNTWVPPAQAPITSEDESFCRYEAAKATASSGVGSIATPYQMADTIANDIATGIRQGELMALCLQNRRNQKQSATVQ